MSKFSFKFLYENRTVRGSQAEAYLAIFHSCPRVDQKRSRKETADGSTAHVAARERVRLLSLILINIRRRGGNTMASSFTEGSELRATTFPHPSPPPHHPPSRLSFRNFTSIAYRFSNVSNATTMVTAIARNLNEIFHGLHLVSIL